MGGDHFLNLQPGTIVNGRYEVVKCLGTGSMGMVYACRHRELAGHIVAMKVLFNEVARDEVAAARFRNEIVASYGVSHPNVVRAYEYFRDGDLIAFTMEFIGGGDIADKIANSDRIPIDEILRMLTQMCSGVQAIHDAGIIHRDLKPENILITNQGDVKITDFGIARTCTGPKLTDHGGVVGTIDYVSPEYLERGEVDARSDIYALGVIAYEMITHEAPFRGKSVIETMTMRLRTDPEPPHNLRPDCPIALSNIVLKAMARDPATRYQAAREMYEDLLNITKSSPVSRASGAQPSVKKESPKKDKENGAASGLRTRPILPKEKDDTSATSYRENSFGIPMYSGSLVQSHAQELFADQGGQQVARSSPQSVKGALAPVEDQDIDPYVQPLDSVLSGNRVPVRDVRQFDDSALQPSIAVSQAHFTSERLKALTHDLQQTEPGSLKTVISSVVIFVLGFGVGWMLLKQFKPEYFNAPRAEQQSPYLDEKPIE